MLPCGSKLLSSDWQLYCKPFQWGQCQGVTTGTTGGHYHRPSQAHFRQLRCRAQFKYVTDSGQGVTGHGSDGVEIPAVRQSRISEGGSIIIGGRRDIIWGHTRVTSVTKQDQVAAIKYPLFGSIHYCRYKEDVNIGPSFRVTLISHLSPKTTECSANHKVLLNSNQCNSWWSVQWYI